MDLGINLDEIREHYEQKGFEFQPFNMLDIPAGLPSTGF